MRTCCAFLFFVLFSLSSFAQGTVRVSGKIEGDDLRPLSNATIYVAGFSSGAFTNDAGEFMIQVAKGKQEVAFSYVGFETQKLNLELESDTFIEVILKSKGPIDEVTIVGQKVVKNISQSNDGVMTLQKQNIMLTPALLGEHDPVHAVQMLPGVQSGNEGVSGIFIRGGSPDQNLIQLDGATIFNPAHLYGFTSVFNSDAINSVTLYKNSFPARYGGRLTSVIDIESDKGDTSKLKGTLSLGFITSHLHMEGPLDKSHKTTFSASIRGCYIGLITSPLSHLQFKKSGYDGNVSYFFYDVNASITHRFNAKNQISLSAFYNDDRYKFRTGNTFDAPDEHKEQWAERQVDWRNTAVALNYIGKVTDRAVFRQSFAFTNYTLYNARNSSYIDNYGANYRYADVKMQNTTTYVNEFSSKSDLNVQIDRSNSVRGGVELVYRTFQTNSGKIYHSQTYSDTSDVDFGDNIIKAGDMSAYAEYDFHPSPKVNINCGVRFNDYLVQDKNYISILPRVSAVYTPVRQFGIRASFASGNQNIHLLTSSQTDISVDYWVPATAKIGPQRGYQLSGGIFGKITRMFEWSIDGFYKGMNDVIEFKEGSAFETSGKNWEDQVWSHGKGKAYGMETYFAKNVGKLTAQASYTLGWSTRQFAELNNGNAYPYKYDRRHNIALQMNYMVNDHWDVGASWVYGSGNMYTLPAQFYDSWGSVAVLNNNLNGNPNQTPKPVELVTIYSGKNNYRLPAYHHLDLTCNYRKKVKKLEHVVNITIYNVYSRQNVFSIFTEYKLDNTGDRRLYLKQLSLFPILPSLTYTINFNS